MRNDSPALALPRPTGRAVALTVAGAALLAAAAWIRVPMWPVPMTMQTLAVLLVGAVGGAGVGAGAVALTMGAAALGLPALAGGAGAALGGPTFGYVIGFMLAAAAVGALVRRGWGAGWRLPLVLLLGNALIYAPGLLWLDLAFLHDWQRTLAGGLFPFMPGDAVKLAMAWALLARFRVRA